MSELRAWPRDRKPAPREMRKRCGPTDAAERQHHAHILQERDFAVEPDAAARKLVRQRFVSRRRAPAGRGDESSPQREAIVPADAGGLVRKSGPVQGGIEKVPAAVAREHPPGAVSPVGRRRQPHDEQPRARIAETGQRPCPVSPVPEPLDLETRDLLAPRDQPRTGAAVDDLAMQRPQPVQDPRVPPRPPPRWLPRGMFCAGPRMPNPR